MRQGDGCPVLMAGKVNELTQAKPKAVCSPELRCWLRGRQTLLRTRDTSARLNSRQGIPDSGFSQRAEILAT